MFQERFALYPVVTIRRERISLFRHANRRDNRRRTACI